jgi:hypothetical protein
MSLNKESIPPTYPQIYDTWDSFASGFMGQILTSNAARNLVCGTYISCGVSTLSGLSEATPQQIVDKVLKQRSDTDRKTIREAFVIFSDIADTGRGGNALYKHIKDNNLGEIMEFGPRMNPNTGNIIKLWVWAPPHQSLNTVDRHLPVYGKILRRDSKGNFSMYEIDPRFVENRNVRGA